MGWNDTKIKILAILDSKDELTAKDIAEQTKLNENQVRIALMRYNHKGLVRRQKKLGCYVYSLTKHGKNRLHYLTSKT